MKHILSTIVISALLINCSNHQPIYKSPQFSVYPDRVEQGNYAAIAESDTSIISTYRSTYKKPTSRILDFKFALNGHDNERYPGEDHHLLLTPVNGKQISPVYTFGKPDPGSALIDHSQKIGNLDRDVMVTIRADMRSVLSEFKQKGYYTLYNGEQFNAKSFKGIYIAGNTLPLSWDFANLPGKSEFKMSDPDSDGIYEITLSIKQFQTADNETNQRKWRQQENISSYPEYHSDYLLSDALYKLSLEELGKDIRDDDAFMAGAKWPGVWTRDISYSILLSLAIIEPEVAQKSLMHKVKNQRIIQDTGTGGSWPVSTDRMTWALAAWEIYVVTGDREWLKQAFDIIKNSAEDDLLTIVNPQTGLFYGESSFLDWREQSYPRWMDPKDIYQSQCLGTNAVHYRTYTILSQMAALLDHPQLATKYQRIAESIKSAMNSYLWVSEKGFYGQYLYGRNYLSLSDRSETLGEALTVLFNIADSAQMKSIISNVPTTPYGTTCFYPQIPDMPAYHNNGIWPFVEAYWAWAAAKTDNCQSVEHSIASIYRQSALFLTNKENMVAQSGDFMGTEINSDRQLWSVAGNLAIIYRIFFGMEFYPDEIRFHPFIPKSFNGRRNLTNVRYRNSILNISIDGYGDGIAEIYLDNKMLKNPCFPASLTGTHNIHIVMNRQIAQSSITLKPVIFSPETPGPEYNGSVLTWNPIKNADHYEIYQNGKIISSTSQPSLTVSLRTTYSEYQIRSIDAEDNKSFLSEPVCISAPETIAKIQPDDTFSGTENHFVPISTEKNTKLHFSWSIDAPGKYAIDFYYSNGNGPINTNNRCAIRSVYLDGEYLRAVIFPQRGDQNWNDWGYSNSIQVNMKAGRHQLTVEYDDHNANMNGKVNSARLKYMRLLCLSKN